MKFNLLEVTVEPDPLWPTYMLNVLHLKWSGVDAALFMIGLDQGLFRWDFLFMWNVWDRWNERKLDRRRDEWRRNRW